LPVAGARRIEDRRLGLDQSVPRGIYAPSQRKSRALIGFAEAVSGPEVAFSLLDAGFDVVAFTRIGAAASLRHCPEVRLLEVTAPADDRVAAVRDLEAQAAATLPDLILPLDDAAVWLCDQLDDRFRSRVAGPTGRQAELALDKRIQVEAAREAGFAVLPTLSVAPTELLARKNEFPLVVKTALAIEATRNVLLPGPVSICADEGELRATVPLYRPDQPVIVQPFVPGQVEGLFGLANEGKVVRASAHRRIRGISAKGSTSACVPAETDPELYAAGQQMLERVGWSGLFMFELLRDREGSAWFLELNGRAWGSMALARRTGFDYPAWVAKQEVEAAFQPPEPGPLPQITCRHLGREILHLLSVLRGPTSAAITDVPPRQRAIRDVLRVRRSDRWYNLDRRHRKLFIYDTVNSVRGGLRSKLRSG
jgi:hypothetical protein